MEHPRRSHSFKVMCGGPLACFTRPEFKVERISYEVPTPSALAGFLKCIYWKPAFQYVIDKIVVFNPIRTMCVKRNELKNKIPCSKIYKAISGKNVDLHVYTEKDTERAQRTTTFLKDVLYGIEFHLEMSGCMAFHPGEGISKHTDILMRRFDCGRVFREPYFGLSECLADYWEIVPEFPLADVDASLRGTRVPGSMLYGLDFAVKAPAVDSYEAWVDTVWSDQATAVYYNPIMVDGVIDVAKWRPEF